MSKICTICARGGSKGVKNKNIRLLAGLPLIAHTILQAKESKLFDMITVSSDSQEILDIASKFGADLLVKRPDELASDFISKLPSIRHAVEESEILFGKQFDVIVDMDVTSPLRMIYDIKNAVDLMLDNNVSNVITGAPARRSPYFNLVEEDENGVVGLSKPPQTPLFRRQDSPRCYDMNASIYVWKRYSLFENPTVFNKDTIIYVMPEERSTDIDSELDFEIVEMLFKKIKKLNFTSRMDFNKEYTNYWQNTISKSVDGLKIPGEFEAAHILKYLEITPSEKVLDLGCSYGRMSNVLSRLSSSIYGIDPDPYAVEQAKNNQYINVVQGTAEITNMPSNFFDVVFSWQVFDVVDQLKGFVELNRILNSNGRFLITGKNYNYFEDDKFAFTAEKNAALKISPIILQN